MNISLKRALKLRKESAPTTGKSLALNLYLACRYGGAKVKDTSIKPAGIAVQRVTDFIDTHLSSTIRIAELADLAQFSEGHFHRVSRATTGQTPLEFVHARPLQPSGGEGLPTSRSA